MRRPLVITRPRHPFRQQFDRLVVLPQQREREPDELKLFALSFTAFFVCFYTFLF